MVRSFHEQIAFDGLWIVSYFFLKSFFYFNAKNRLTFQDMNEPSNFYDGQEHGCPSESSYENPPYLPNVNGNKLYSKTLCMTSNQFLSSHYNTHNLYGISEAMMTYA